MLITKENAKKAGLSTAAMSLLCPLIDEGNSMNRYRHLYLKGAVAHSGLKGWDVITALQELEDSQIVTNRSATNCDICFHAIQDAVDSLTPDA